MNHRQMCWIAFLFFTAFAASGFIPNPALSKPAEPAVTKGPRCSICEGAESRRWLKSAGGKLLRGITNAGLGWMNLFARTQRAVADGENVLIGIGKGFGYTAGRTIQGGLETALFFFPPAEDEPLRNCVLGDLGWTGR